MISFPGIHLLGYLANIVTVPAVYYAHLIANRARHHEDIPASSGPRSAPQVKITNPKPEKRPIDPRLLPIYGTSNRLPFQMWFI